MRGLRLGLGFGRSGSAEAPSIPAGAIQQRDAAYILDRDGNYITVR